MLIFTRHPRTFSNDFLNLPEERRGDHSHWYSSDSKITEMGRQQAIQTSHDFKKWLDITGIHIDRVAVSPSSRTLEYASILLPIIQCEALVFIEPLIREKVKSGCISNIGLSRDQVKNTIQENNWLKEIKIDYSRMSEDWNTGEESDDEFNNRVQKARNLYFGNFVEKERATLVISHWLYGNLFLKRPDSIHNCEFILCQKNGEHINTERILVPA